MHIEKITKSPDETEELGGKFGGSLKGGECIEFASDLGGGKTTFVRGLARGAGSSDSVSSPTFTISQVYNTRHFDIHHFDFYRLQDPGLVREELSELINTKDVILVEWAESVTDALPTERIKISITKDKDNESHRIFTFEIPESLSSFMEAVK